MYSVCIHNLCIYEQLTNKYMLKVKYFVEIVNTQGMISLTLKEAHELHDQLTEFINNNPLPDED